MLFAAFNKMPNDATCTTYNIQESDYIECGTGSSVYHTVELTQCPKPRDVPNFGVLNSWRTRPNDLKLHPRQLDLVPDVIVTTSQRHHLLNGWDIYEWKGSVIEGYCCIANLNYDNQTTHLYLFLNETYAYEFQSGSDAHHYLWSEQLNLPTNRTSCFQKWGRNAPYTVEHNSYHFFGVDLPANVELSSNITVLQMTVNVSDYPYSEPKWFTNENHTDISLPGTVFPPVEYIFICGPPEHFFSEPRTNKQIQMYLSDISTHICTCKQPNEATRNALLPVGIVLFFFLAMFTLCACVCCFIYCYKYDCKCCYKYCCKCCCTCCRLLRRRDYRRLN